MVYNLLRGMLIDKHLKRKSVNLDNEGISLFLTECIMC